MASETDETNLRELKCIAVDMGFRWERRYVEAAIKRLEAAEARVAELEEIMGDLIEWCRSLQVSGEVISVHLWTELRAIIGPHPDAKTELTDGE